MCACSFCFPPMLTRQCHARPATLIVELKFTHQCGKVGHIEDVVTDSSVRGRGFGKRLVKRLLSEAAKLGCYKVILDANEKNVAFYEKCGFAKKEFQMRHDLDADQQK